MAQFAQTHSEAALADERSGLLRLLALTTFIVFFQGYMVAPIIPLLSKTLHTSEQFAGLIVPAYLIPYGISTLIYGVLADRIGIHRVMMASLVAFSVLSILTATAQTVEQLMMFRVATGIGASGVVPLALALVGRLYPFEQRGKALGWLFGAMAGGMAFGSPLGSLLEPYISWQGLFLAVGVAGLVLVLVLLPKRHYIATAAQPVMGSLGEVLSGYKQLLGPSRARRTYAYVLINSMFHSGVFTWLGLYLEREHHLGPTGIGLALLGYGVPGFLLGPVIGAAADRWGRARLIPAGLLIGAGAAALLTLQLPTAAIPVVALLLSLGYDMTQPLFGGIVTSLGGKRAGQAMGLNVFTLFVGFGFGSLAFGALLPLGFTTALIVFAAVETLVGLLAFSLFREERPMPS